VNGDETALDALAGAILDGTSVNWRAVRRDTADSGRSLVDEMEVVAMLADFHRRQRVELAPPPDMWGHIRVLEPLGTGAFGHVYRGWDTRLDREVALKLLPAQSEGDNARTSSIIEEGRLLARVHHPNVVTVYGAERLGDSVGLWMELIDGETVEQRLARGLPFHPSEVIEIGTQICQAVSAVHRAGLLHRDIKAQNVMLARDGRAVLMDFGTGWEMRETGEPAPALAGTPLYLAPELLQGDEATIQSDVYSIGVLLYRMLTGSYPWCGRTVADLRIAHRCRSRVDVATARRDVPRRLARIVERALETDAERRHASADVLAAALAGLEPRRAVIPLKYAIAASATLVLGGLLLAAGALSLHHQGTAAQTSAQPASEGPSIAVLPLQDLGSETGGEEFADGFTEELINALAADGHVQVRSRTSSFAFKNTQRDLQDVARQLNVDLVLEGSIQRSANRFHVAVRLLQASTGVALWNEQFDADIGNVFAARNRIVQRVGERLGTQRVPSRRAYDLNPAAYGRYLAARALVTHRGPVGPQKAIEYFQQVIAIAPEFAPAYAGIADAYAYLSVRPIQGAPLAKVQELMRAAALKALELDPDLAEAHAAMGLVDARDLAWASSERHFERAIALNPSLSQVYTSYSFFTLRPLRKFDRAKRLLKTAMQRDPLSVDVWREMAQLSFTVGRYDEAIDLLQRIRAVEPQLPFADLFLARALACAGRVDEAMTLYDAMEAHGPAGASSSRDGEGVTPYHAYAYVKAGRRSDAERLAAENNDYPHRAALIYAALGDRDRAFDALARTAEQQPQRIPLLLTYPELAPLRGDPRMTAIQRRFGLP
jgi:serine/threonine-protein kinase